MDYLYAFSISFGSFILCFYLCYKQRFPLRAYHTVVIPFLAFMLIIVVRLIQWKKNDKCKTIYAIWKPALIAGIAVVIGVYSIVIAKDQAKDRIIKSNRTLQIEQYAIENPENFYIYDTSLTFRYLPFTTYTDEYPSNLMFWGGMGCDLTCFFSNNWN